MTSYNDLQKFNIKLFEKLNKHADKGMGYLLSAAGGGVWNVEDEVKEYTSSLLLRKYYNKKYSINTNCKKNNIIAGYNLYLIIINHYNLLFLNNFSFNLICFNNFYFNLFHFNHICFNHICFNHICFNFICFNFINLFNIK